MSYNPLDPPVMQTNIFFILTWLPKTPIAVAVETSSGPNQTAANLAGMPSMNTWATEHTVCANISTANLSDSTETRHSSLMFLKPNTHRRRDTTVELSPVGGVNAPVGSRDPVYNFLCC